MLKGRAHVWNRSPNKVVRVERQPIKSVCSRRVQGLCKDLALAFPTRGLLRLTSHQYDIATQNMILTSPQAPVYIFLRPRSASSSNLPARSELAKIDKIDKIHFPQRVFASHLVIYAPVGTRLGSFQSSSSTGSLYLHASAQLFAPHYPLHRQPQGFTHTVQQYIREKDCSLRVFRNNKLAGLWFDSPCSHRLLEGYNISLFTSSMHS